MKEIKIDENYEGERVNKYLLRLFPNIASSFLYKMFRKKNIVLNDKTIKGNELLKKDDRLTIYFKDETFEKFSKKNDLKFDEEKFSKEKEMLLKNIIYEDENILVIDKWKGIKSQNDKKDDISLNEVCKFYLREKNIDIKSSSIINRLDTNTFGIILFAKNYITKREISKMISERKVKKEYVALVNGDLKEDGELNLYMTKDEKINKVKVVENGENSYLTKTKYKVLENLKNFSIVSIEISTGKPHQIRVAFSYINHPIVCDKKYMTKNLYEENKKNFKFDTQMLISKKIKFENIENEKLSYLSNKSFTSRYELREIYGKI